MARVIDLLPKWLASDTAHEQIINQLRQSNVAFTLDPYTQTDNEELISAQNLMLDAIFQPGNRAVQ